MYCWQWGGNAWLSSCPLVVMVDWPLTQASNTHQQLKTSHTSLNAVQQSMPHYCSCCYDTRAMFLWPPPTTVRGISQCTAVLPSPKTTTSRSNLFLWSVSFSHFSIGASHSQHRPIAFPQSDASDPPTDWLTIDSWLWHRADESYYSWNWTCSILSMHLHPFNRNIPSISCLPPCTRIGN